MTNEHTILDDRYILRRRIASGGMGEVWRAEDRLLGREVAIKVLRSSLADDESFRNRFRSEARITAGLTHPGIAQVFDYGEHDGLSYLVMELVEGEPLAALLSRAGAPNAEALLDLLVQAARGMHAAHEAGIIHRDIKPGNLLITPSGQVKITDFGIARLVEATAVTQTGTVFGTAQYVSPEQASGRQLTPASDIYSLGIVAYECLAGQPPFNAESPVAVGLMHLREHPPSLPPKVPEPVRELIFNMLAKDPGDRPASARAVAEHAAALRAMLLSGDPQALQAGTLRDDVVADAQEPTGDPPEFMGDPHELAGDPHELAGDPDAPTTIVTLGDAAPKPPRKRRTWASLAVVGSVGVAAFVVSVLVLGAFTGGGDPVMTIDADPTRPSPTVSEDQTGTPDRTPSPVVRRTAEPTDVARSPEPTPRMSKPPAPSMSSKPPPSPPPSRPPSPRPSDTDPSPTDDPTDSSPTPTSDPPGGSQ